MSKQVSLFEFAVLLQPLFKDEERVEDGKVVVEPRSVLASSLDQAQLLAARSIPEAFVDRIDRLTVVVRPF